MGFLGKGAETAKAIRKGIEAWHGSPHKFDKFSMEKIGTGEGAQAYGHGLYFADSQDLATSYRKALAKRNPLHSGSDRLEFLEVDGGRLVDQYPIEFDGEFLDLMDDQDIVVASRHARERAKKWRQLEADESYPYRDYAAEKAEAWEGLAPRIKAGDVSDPSLGSLYRVHLDVDPDTLLDWDAPLSAQPENVRKALKALPDPKVRERIFGLDNTGHELSGAQAYGVLQDYFRAGRPDNIFDGGTGALGQADASAELRELGIPGIKYWDEQSRSAGEGTRNYVMFSDEPISILERGRVDPRLLGAMAAGSVASAGLLGAGAATHGEMLPPEHPVALKAGNLLGKIDTPIGNPLEGVADYLRHIGYQGLDGKNKYSDVQETDIGETAKKFGWAILDLL